MRVDPFRALRIAMLAQASSLVGAFTGGMGVAELTRMSAGADHQRGRDARRHLT